MSSIAATLLCPTPRERLVDGHGRPYFLWDVELSLEEFERRLADAAPEARAYWTGKLMRQAKPDDVLTFLSSRELLERWQGVERYLGRSRPFWAWLLGTWHGMDLGAE